MRNLGVSVRGLVVFAALSVGGFHLLEHIVQVLQRYLLGIPNGNGLLGSVADIEPVHFAYNVAYFAALAAALALWGRWTFAAHSRAGKLILFAAIFQGWHVFEHMIKMFQYWQSGQNGTGGVLGAGPGALFPLVPIPLLHLAYNVLVYAPPVIAIVLLARISKRERESSGWRLSTGLADTHSP